MNNYFVLIGKDLKKLWGGLELPQKLAIVVLTIITFAAMSYFIAKSTEPNWSVLYSDLSEPDAVAIVENLKKGGYPYKVSDDKKSILVPQEIKEDLRIMIAENDVIQDSSPGFELLDKMQLGATDFQNNLTKQRIYQGELTRTIEKIRGITKARVQIATPERSIFSDKDEAPSASVMLILEPGTKLSQQQIKAIKNLVAYGIPRLTPDKVFLTNQNGVVLTDEVSEGGTNDIETFQSNFEKNTAKKIQTVLEKIVGSKNVSVEVSAIMNFDSAKSTIERYIPNAGNEGILALSQKETEQYGKDGNAPENNPAAGQNKNTNYSKIKAAENYKISKEIKQVVYAPGSVQRMTIAVAMNKILTDEQKEEIKNLVISASGADMARGDMVNITSMKFASIAEEQTAQEELMNEIKKDSQIDIWLNKIAPLVTVLVLGLSALFIFSSLLKKPIQGQEVYEPEERFYDEPERHDEPELIETPHIPVIEAKLEPELERMKTDINNLILSDPTEASRILLSYIKE